MDGCVGVESEVCLSWRVGSDWAPMKWDVLAENHLGPFFFLTGMMYYQRLGLFVILRIQ